MNNKVIKKKPTQQHTPGKSCCQAIIQYLNKTDKKRDTVLFKFFISLKLLIF